MKVKNFIETMVCRYEDDDVSAMGAQLTYYLLLSFFPFLIFVITFIGYANITAEDMLETLNRLLPDVSNQTIHDVVLSLEKTRNGSLLSIGIIATVWTASRGVDAIMKALNKAYEVEEKRAYWKVKAISIIFTLVLFVVIIFSFVMLVFGEILGQKIFAVLDVPYYFETVWSIVKFIIPLVTMTLVYIALYIFIPNQKLKFTEALPGALFTTFGWIATSMLFSFYVNNYGNYTKTYGSIGGIIVLLTWLYISSIIIILGGEINATLYFDRRGLAKPDCKKYSLPFSFWKKKRASS